MIPVINTSRVNKMVLVLFKLKVVSRDDFYKVFIEVGERADVILSLSFLLKDLNLGEVDIQGEFDA